MADVSKIFKPRRGTASIMAGTKSSTVLASGELFVEVPNTGVGTGASKIKIGDGTTAYSSLPYALGDTSNDKINFSSNTSTTVAAALNSVVTGASLKNIVAGLKQAISLCNTSITQLNDDIENSDVGNMRQELDELNDSLGGLQFGVDENGNYGYIKAGADSVTPFKSGVTLIDSDLYTSKTHALKSGKYLFDCCMFSSYATLSHFDLTIDGTPINVEDSIGSEYTSTNGTLKLLSAKPNSNGVGGYGSVSVVVELNLNTDENVNVSYTASNNPGGMAVSIFEN